MKRTLILGMVFLFPVCGVFAQAPSHIQKPLSKVELMALVEADPRQAHLKWVVVQRGIDFHLTEAYLNCLKEAGAKDALIEAVRKAPVPGAQASPGPDAVARENQVLQHLVQAARKKQEKAWKEAEKEYRSALAIEPDNPLLHVDLATVLPVGQGESGWDAAIAEDHEALRLDPDLAVAHLRNARVILGYYDASPLPEFHDYLLVKPDHMAAQLQVAGVLHPRIKGAVDEYREVVRLDPDDADAWSELGLLLEEMDTDAAMAAYREAVARKPDDPLFHALLAELLWKRPRLIVVDAQVRNDNQEEATKEMGIASALQAKSKPGRVWMGSWVTAYRLSYYADSYFNVREAALAGIEGTVRMEGVIRKDGSVQDLKVLCGHPALVKAALQGVSRYRYQPILLNGIPVEVVTEIDKLFTIVW